MLRLKKIDHVAICTRDIDVSAPAWRALFQAFSGALSQEHRESVEPQKTDALFLSVGGEGCSLELIAPDGNDGLERFLAKRGPGLHHVALEVEGIEEAIAALKAMGATMIDETPRPGARGHRVAFVHPKSFGGVLIELVES
jgi:methylmalonyl-CoA/ethylmalonyl-CoA epimerase